MFIFLVFLASFFYGLEPSVISIALNNGLDANHYVMVSAIFCIFYSVVLALINKESLKVNKKQLIYLVIGGVFFYYMSYILGLCYEIIPVGLATTIHFTYPTIVYFISVIFFKEKVTLRRIVSIIVCLLGLLLLSEFGKGINIKGFLLALVTACCYAAYLIIVDKSEVNKLPSSTISMYTSIMSLVCSLLSVGNISRNDLSIIYNELFYIVCASLLVFAAMFLINIGLKKIGASIASALMVVEPISSLVISTILFKYDISTTTIIGSVLILLSIVIVVKND